MTDSPSDRPNARTRAFDIFKASGGRIPNLEILAHLTAEGYQCTDKNISVWKSRDKWLKKVPKGSKGAGIIGLERMLIQPKVEKMAELDRVERLGDASDDLLQTAGILAQKLRSWVETVKPEQIQFKDAGIIIEKLGSLFTYCAAIDAEVQRRKDKLKSEIEGPNAPGAVTIDHAEIPAIQRAAEEFAQKLITVRRIT